MHGSAPQFGSCAAGDDARDERDQPVEDEADDADVDQGHDDVGQACEEFHASQMKKPMPTPPVSISAATMASQDEADADPQAREDVGRGRGHHDLAEELDAG